MGHGNHSPRKGIQILFQYRKRRDIQVVGRFVQQQYVRRFHQNAQQVQPPLFPAAEFADGHPLQFRWEQEPFQHHGRADIGPVCRQHIIACVPYVFQHTCPGVGEFTVLGKIANLHRLPNGYRAAVRLQPSCNDIHQGGLPHAVGTDDPHPVIPQQDITEIVDVFNPFIKAGYVFQFHHRLAKAGRRGSDFQFLPVHLFFGSRFDFRKPFHPVFLFCSAGFRAPADPGKLPPVNILQLTGRRAFQFPPLRSFLQESAVVGRVQIGSAVIQFQRAVDDAVEEIPVMGHHQQRALALL